MQSKEEEGREGGREGGARRGEEKREEGKREQGRGVVTTGGEQSSGVLEDERTEETARNKESRAGKVTNITVLLPTSPTLPQEAQTNSNRNCSANGKNTLCVHSTTADRVR